MSDKSPEQRAAEHLQSCGWDLHGVEKVACLRCGHVDNFSRVCAQCGADMPIPDCSLSDIRGALVAAGLVVE